MHMTGNFTQISNALIGDARLSCGARMLMIWILSRLDGEQSSEEQWQKVLGIKTIFSRMFPKSKCIAPLKALHKDRLCDFAQILDTELVA